MLSRGINVRVIRLDDCKIYNSAADAGREIGVTNGAILRSIQERRRCKGWSYATLPGRFDQLGCDKALVAKWSLNIMMRQVTRRHNMSKVVYVGWLRDWLCDNGDIITAYDLGRDGGADLIVRNNKSDIIGLVTCDDGEMYAECAKALDNGDLSSADAALDGWENGFGSSPFDRDYLPDSVEVIG